MNVLNIKYIEYKTMTSYFKYETKNTSWWRQDLMSESLIFSFNRFVQKSWFIQEWSKLISEPCTVLAFYSCCLCYKHAKNSKSSILVCSCLYKWLIESLTRPIHSKTWNHSVIIHSIHNYFCSPNRAKVVNIDTIVSKLQSN